MQTYRLKNIIILILALINLALLMLLGSEAIQERQAEQQELNQLVALYERSGITLSLKRLPQPKYSQSQLVTRNEEKEAAFVRNFLGQFEKTEDGSIYTYTSDTGTARFRRNGAFEMTFLSPYLSVESCLALLKSNHFTLIDHSDLPDNSGTLYAIALYDDAAIAGGSTALSFENGLLTSISGYYVNSSQPADSIRSFSAVDALSEFLDYCQENGVICSSILHIESAWMLRTETLFQSMLTPIWMITTDSSRYYVDLHSDEVALL